MDLINLDDLFKIFKAAAEQPQQLDSSEYWNLEKAISERYEGSQKDRLIFCRTAIGRFSEWLLTQGNTNQTNFNF